VTHDAGQLEQQGPVLLRHDTDTPATPTDATPASQVPPPQPPNPAATAPTSTVPAPFPDTPAPIIYLLTVATGGLYLAYWVYQLTRALDIDREHRRTPWFWGVAALCPLLGWLLLYQLCCYVQRSLPDARLQPKAMALAYAAFAVLLALPPVRACWSFGIVVLPLPWFLLQLEVNRLAPKAQRVTPAWRWAVRWAVIAAGLVAVSAISYTQDMPEVRAALAQVALTTDGVAIAGTPVRFKLPSRDWRIARPGTRGDASAALELTGPTPATWLVAYVHEGSQTSLGDRVDLRRSLVSGDATLDRFEERRFFLQTWPTRVASRAIYGVKNGPLQYDLFAVATIALDTGTVEIIAHSERGEKHESALLAIIDSVFLDGDVARPSPSAPSGADEIGPTQADAAAPVPQGGEP
jgi:hypothetical protein